MKNTLETLGLDFTVEAQPIYTAAQKVIPSKSAIVRADSNAVLGVVGNKYVPIQNQQVLDLLEAGAEKVGLEVTRGGAFDNGAKYYIQIKSDNLIINDDLVEGFITGVNSHDGSTAFRFGNTNETISCKNQFNRLFRTHLKTSFRHTLAAASQIDALAKDIENQLQLEQQMFQQMKQLAEAPLKDFGTQVTDIILKEVAGVAATLEDDISTKKQNIIDELKDSLAGEIHSKGSTLWGAFSGVTHYTTHKVSHRANHDRQKVMGHLAIKENAVFNKLTALV